MPVQTLSPKPFKSPRSLAAVVIASLMLGACSGGSGPDLFNSETQDQWFSKPFKNFSARDTGVSVADTSVRPATPEDFVDGSGRCAMAAAPAQPAVSADGTPAQAPMGPTVTGGIALLMTECEVVSRAGAPERVDIGTNPGGERTAVLTYTRGTWPGIYRFTAGRLSEVERVAEPEQPKPAPKKKPRAQANTRR